MDQKENITLSQIVDDFIHETYLEGLTEEELIENLEKFSEICGKVISETISDGRKIIELNNRLSVIRNSQISGNFNNVKKLYGIEQNENDSFSFEQHRVKKIVENKRLILTAIEQIAPQTAQKIKDEIDPFKARERIKNQVKYISRLKKLSSETIPTLFPDNISRKVKVSSRKLIKNPNPEQKQIFGIGTAFLTGFSLFLFFIGILLVIVNY